MTPFLFTDSEILDWMEKRAREFAAFCQAASMDEKPYAWSAAHAGVPSFSIADGSTFHYPTLRHSVCAEMMAGQEGLTETPFSECEPDEPVVQEVNRG